MYLYKPDTEANNVCNLKVPVKNYVTLKNKALDK